MPYFVIQDRHVGYIYHVCEAPDEDEALQAFDDDVGIDLDDEGLDTSQWDFTEVLRDQFDYLKDCAGDEQAAIDLVETIKERGPALRYKLVDMNGNSPAERWEDLQFAIRAAEERQSDVFVENVDENTQGSICVWAHPEVAPE